MAALTPDRLAAMDFRGRMNALAGIVPAPQTYRDIPVVVVPRAPEGALAVVPRRDSAVLVYESEREIPIHFKLELMLADTVHDIDEAQRQNLARELTVALDRLISKAVYGVE